MAKPPKLYKGAGGEPIHVLTPSGERLHATVAGTSASQALGTNWQIVRVSSTTDCYVKFGTVGVVATADEASTLFPKGVELLAVPPDATHVAYIQLSAAGVIQVEAMN